jgi:hypothetical protein
MKRFATALVATAFALTACGRGADHRLPTVPGAVTVPAGGQAPTPTPAAATTTAATATSAASTTRPSLPTPPSTIELPDVREGDPGTVSFTMTAPVEVGGWAPVPVECAAEARKYTASFNGAVVGGVSISATVTAAPYRGPGTYPGAGTVTVVTPNNGTTTVPLAAPVTVDDTLDGTVAIDTTVQGIAVAFTLTWHCTV